MELRCPSRLHGILAPDGLVEVKCRSKHCGASAEVTVMHYFDPLTGDLRKTQRFRSAETAFNGTKKEASVR